MLTLGSARKQTLHSRSEYFGYLSYKSKRVNRIMYFTYCLIVHIDMHPRATREIVLWLLLATHAQAIPVGVLLKSKQGIETASL